MSPVEGYGVAISLRSSFWRKSHENMTKIVHLIQLSHIPSTSLNFSIVTFKAPLFRKEVIGWKEAIASRRLGTKKVDVLKKLSTTAELEKYSINGYISYEKLRVFFSYFQKVLTTCERNDKLFTEKFSVSLSNISVLTLGI